MKDNIIRCPICGQEYLPSEIFFPNDLIGKPTEIIKTNAGKIDFYLGEDPTYEETYICDGCGASLKIKANLSFQADVVSNKFNEEYVTKFEKPKKILLEESSLFD